MFHQIALHAQLPVDYKDGLLDDLYFTGDLSQNDDLNAILDIITRMNNLEYRYQSDRIEIYGKNNK